MKNFKIHIPLTLFLVAIIVFVVLWQNFKFQNKALVQYENFSETFFNEKKKLESFTEKSRIYFLSSQRLIPETNKENLILNVYKHDSLVLWNSNKIFIPLESLSKDTGFNIIQFANGYYQSYLCKHSEYTFIGLNLIKHDYPYQNEYLPNKFNKNYSINEDVQLRLKPGQYNISLGKRTYLSLHFPENNKLSDDQQIILFVLFLSQFILLVILLFNIYSNFSKYLKRKLLLVIAFSADIIIIRFLLYYFKFPGIIYQGDIFSPINFSYVFMFSSLGDLLLNAICIFAIIYFIFKHLPELPVADKKNNIRLSFRLFTIFLHLFIFYDLIAGLQSSIVMDSSHSMDLSNFLELDIYSYLLLISFTIICFSYFILSIKLFNYSFYFYNDNKALFLSTLFFTIALALIYFILTGSSYIIVLPAILLLFYTVYKIYFNSLTNFYQVIFYVLVFAAILSYSFNQDNFRKLNAEKSMLAMSLLNRGDPISEYRLSTHYNTIINDSIIKYYLNRSIDNTNYEDSIESYISSRYIEPSFPAYLSITTVCNSGKMLDIQPDGIIINCHEYFEDLKTQYGDSTSYKGLYTIKNVESSQYLIEYPISTIINGEKENFILFTELLYNYNAGEGLGYPELLIDSRFDDYINTSQLSYAKYYKNDLIFEIGKFEFNGSLNEYPLGENASYFNYNGYLHYIYKSGDYTVIVSSKIPGVIERISTFSFLLVFFLIFILAFSMIFILPYQFRSLEMNHRNKLQASMILIILSVFILIGSITISYMINLYEDKNEDILKEKTNSVLIELEHKLSNEPDIGPDQSEYLSGLLEKFSMVFFSDINLYDLDGALIATSRPQVFEFSLMSDLMNYESLNQLEESKSLYIHNEQIGTYKYLSAYSPFKNSDNKVVAYLNLPYFARQTELRHEISMFLTTFINVYILFVAIAIVLSLIISRYTTRPLQILKEKLASLSIDKSNEKIEWKGRDEIGKLVAEYNRMVDELGQSAELLAQSERETAWREMAKQVAHEIKNPLTPMKLSVQYLQKAWEDKSPDWDNRLKRFSKTIIEQIDSLSTIASEFSDFAKMPAAKIEETDISEIIQNSIELYLDYSNISISFEYDRSDDYHLKADKKQLLRVFNNLIKNSIQALSQNEKGKIDITLARENDTFNISISDNGPGIPEELFSKIFSPSFTTKSSGMGLGLAIVNSILISYGGSISFDSEIDKGTTFYISLPVT